MSHKIPVVVKDLARQWPAYSKWNWNYFKQLGITTFADGKTKMCLELVQHAHYRDMMKKTAPKCGTKARRKGF